MDECLVSLVEAHIFSKLDANSGFGKIEIDDYDKNKKKFKSLYGLYRN